MGPPGTSHFVGMRQLDDDLDTVVVVDTIRAFTVAAWAFARGAEKIVLAADPDQALALTARYPGALTVKDGPPAAGFDTVNSPGLVSRLDLAGRTVIQTTTSGTVGALAARHATRVVCASFVVAGATARELRRHRPADVTYLVTGDDGQADEDRACAEYIAALTRDPSVAATPFVDRAARSAAAAELVAGVRRGYQGTHADDLPLCLEHDRFAFAMLVDDRDGDAVVRPVAASG
ncbi:2-phosphosulfolactate phosphatase [Micromonospora sp. NPDC049051]|uniref:2-phosphosulfolactate phosphatase n=1 Tax=unclassified Micromonospora TaxID=2617518 RepID=UPI0037215525